MTGEALLREAEQARARAYAPYSGFCVGAALLGKSGAVYRGCNIENAAFSVTVCAERTALFSAVAAGEREFSALAVVGAPAGQPGGYAPPCGVCRQALSEFCPGGFPVYLRDGAGNSMKTTLEALLPLRFASDNLTGKEQTE